MAEGEKQECALVERNCVLFYVIKLLREENFKPDLNYSVKSFKFSMRCGLYPPASLFISRKESCNLCMNRASLDRVS